MYGGTGLGHTGDGAAVFVWNALPGEGAEAEITKRKRGYSEGVAREILLPSSLRVSPQEAHFLSCSPWQILAPEGEEFWKKAIARETYKSIGGFDPGESLALEGNGRLFGYRNKMEFSFAENERGELSIAFFARGTKYRIPIKSCALAMPEINACALEVVRRLRAEHIPVRSLKTLVVRANQKKEVCAALFVKDALPEFSRVMNGFAIMGIQIYYSDPRSPASRPDALLFTEGADKLSELVAGVNLSYGTLGFFQVNVPMFERAIADMRSLVKGEDVIDYYSGAGAIGLALAGEWHSCAMVEENEEAVKYAQKNIKQNAVQNCTATASPSEKMRDCITKDKVIIFDPPRAGLHPKIIARLLEVKPKRVIYLSCNPSTQARDIKLLAAVYRVAFLKLYNFFPRTAHIEALVALERIENSYNF